MRGSAGGACTARGGAACGPAYNETHAYQRPGNRLPPLRDRPRAAARHRRARDGPLGRRPRERRGRRDGLADDPRLPDPQPLPDGVAQAVRELEGVTGVNISFDVLSDNEKAALGRKLGRGSLPEGALAQVEQRDLRRLGQGRRRQVERDRQPRRGARRRGQARRRARRRRVGLLTAADARPRRRAPAGQRRAQDHPADRARRDQRDVDRLLHRAGRRRRVARPDAPQGAPAVPRGRRVGRARLPADRPAARHRRRLDDARPAAAAGEVRDRDDAAAGRPEGRPALGRDGHQAEARDRRA